MKKILFVLSLLLVVSFSQSQTRADYPATTKQPASSDYQGVTVTEDYRWLEDFDVPAVKEWNRAQNAFTRSYLDAVPFRSALANRLKQLLQNRAVSYSEISESGGKLFALKADPKRNQRKLVFLKSADDVQSELTVVDPEALNPKGTTAIDWFVPSVDGKLVAVSLSENGSEDGTLYTFNAETGKKLTDVIPRVQYPTGGGSAAWDKDGTGFYYTRYPHEGEGEKEDLNFYQQVYYHKLGTPSTEDTYVIGKEFPRIPQRDGRGECGDQDPQCGREEGEGETPARGGGRMRGHETPRA